MAVHTSLSTRNTRRSSTLKYVAACVTAVLLLFCAHVLLRAPADPPADLTYGLMIDAGSTGSRMHTFGFRKSASGVLKIASEDFFPVKPGLSAYKDDPAAAALSLAPLLERARSKVPTPKRATTPVYLRATAGLRLTGEDKAEAILNEVRKYLGASGFLFNGPSSASILGGSDEGVYSWITVNYLLGRTGSSTVGTLEMGGGSAQVAFVPQTAPSGSKCNAKTQLQAYSGKRLSLYTKSDLGFGLQKARALAFAQFEGADLLAKNPCVNSGPTVNVKIPFHPQGKSVGVDGAGDFAHCRLTLEKTLVAPTQKACSCSACGYNGDPRPQPIHEYVAIAFYRERTAALGIQTPTTVKEIVEKGEEICKMSVKEVQRAYPSVPNGVATDLCFDLAYIVTHLHHGHGITENSGTVLHVRNTIGGYELGWSLGAMFDEMSKLNAGTQSLN